MNVKKLHNWVIPVIIILSIIVGCSHGQYQDKNSTQVNETGIADIDIIRREMVSIPTTEENAASRHAALNRWWRLLWRQGYDMSSFDSTASLLVLSNGYDNETITTINHGYGLLENLFAAPVYIKRITGSSKPANSSSDESTHTDWPFYHGIDGAQTGYSPDNGPLKGQLAWRFPKSQNFNKLPVINDGKIYLSSPGIDVIGYCLDEKSGKIEWRARQFGIKFYGTPRANASPFVTDDRMIISVGSRMHVVDKNTGKQIKEPENYTGANDDLIVIGGSGRNFRLYNANTGKETRSYKTEQPLIGEPELHKGEIYVNCEEGMVYAFSNESKDFLWKSRLDAKLRGKPKVADGHIYVGSSDGKLFALNTKDGKPHWTYQDDRISGNAYTYYSLPVVSNDRLYIGTASSELLCINSKSGELIWKQQVSDWVRSSPLLIKDKIYVTTLSGEMFVIADNGDSAEVLKEVKLTDHGFTADLVGNENGILATGDDLILYSVSPESLSLNWKHGILDGVWKDDQFATADWTGGLQPSPTVVDGILYSGGLDGFVHALNSETGEEIWRFEGGGRCSAAITVAEGKLFFGQITGDGTYYALDKNTGELIWQSEEFDNVWVGASYTENGLFFGNMEGMMFGVNPKDGSVIWSYDTSKDTPKEDWRNMSKRGHGWPPGIYPVPVTDETKVYIGSWSGYYFAFDQKTGKMVWRTQTNEGNLNGGLPDSAAPVLWKGHLYVQKVGRILAALKTDDGAVAWEWRAPRPFLQNGTIVAHNDKIFGSYAHRATVIPYNSTIIAFDDVENGSEELWRYKGGGGLTAPVITDGKLISGSSCDPFVVCLNPNDGSVIWRFYTGGEMRENVPAIYGNKVYVHINTGWLYAIK